MDRNEGDCLTFMEFNVRTPSCIKKQGPFCSLGHYKYIGPSASRNFHSPQEYPPKAQQLQAEMPEQQSWEHSIKVLQLIL